MNTEEMDRQVVGAFASEPPLEHDLQNAQVTGTEVHYFALCPRKFWWFAHGMEQEHSGGASGSSHGQENVALGTLLHATAYADRKRRDVLIDGLIRLDFTEGGAVQEVKKSRGALRATRLQVLYYLYYLKQHKGVETTGVIEFPKERRREVVELTPEREAEVVRLLRDLEVARAQPTPPPVAEPMPICKRCSYQDLCWG